MEPLSKAWLERYLKSPAERYHNPKIVEDGFRRLLQYVEKDKPVKAYKWVLGGGALVGVGAVYGFIAGRLSGKEEAERQRGLGKDNERQR